MFGQQLVGGGFVLGHRVYVLLYVFNDGIDIVGLALGEQQQVLLGDMYTGLQVWQRSAIAHTTSRFRPVSLLRIPSCRQQGTGYKYNEFFHHHVFMKVMIKSDIQSCHRCPTLLKCGRHTSSIFEIDWIFSNFGKRAYGFNSHKKR